MEVAPGRRAREGARERDQQPRDGDERKERRGAASAQHRVGDEDEHRDDRHDDLGSDRLHVFHFVTATMNDGSVASRIT